MEKIGQSHSDVTYWLSTTFCIFQLGKDILLLEAEVTIYRGDDGARNERRVNVCEVIKKKKNNITPGLRFIFAVEAKWSHFSPRNRERDGFKDIVVLKNLQISRPFFREHE